MDSFNNATKNLDINRKYPNSGNNASGSRVATAHTDTTAGENENL